MPTTPIVAAYLYQGRAWKPDEIRADLLTHINYAFTTIEGGVLFHRFPDERLTALAELKARHPHLKTVLSVGGQGADGFSDAALTPEARAQFNESVVRFVKAHNFDGVDLDWEYPTHAMAGIMARPEDKTNFTLLLKDLRAALDRQGAADGKRYLLTIAAGAGQYFLNGVEMDRCMAYLDWVNLMTYDFSEFDKTTGHHANLYTPAANPAANSADKAVRLFMANGVAPDKIVIGAAFYGRGMKEVASAERHGLFQDFKENFSPGGYANLAKAYNEANGFARYWDDSARAPYLFDGSTFITFEDPESVRLKGEYVRAHGLAGAMFWEYYCDPTGTLLGALAAGIRAPGV